MDLSSYTYKSSSCERNKTRISFLINSEGALKTQVYEIEKLTILNPEKLTKSQLSKLSEAFDKLSQREIGSVFEEIGSETPEDVSLDNIKPDRRELDKIIFEILGLTEKEQSEVYKAVIDLVKSRIEKAKSFSKNNKKKVSEVDSVVKRTLDSLGGEDILKNFFESAGEANILSLPRFRKDAGIEKTIHGWQLTDGLERIFFDDKKAAEYCKILSFIGMEKVRIPKELTDDKINELQNNIYIINNTINSTIKTITDKKMRDKIKSLVLGKIISKTNGI